jgi:hypothetical protein
MAEIYRPQKKSSGFSGALGTVGSVVGGWFGGSGGSAAGGAIGSAIGEKKAENAAPAAQIKPQSALDRRLKNLEDDPLRQISDSVDSLQYVQDPQQRAELAKPLMQAQYLAQQKKMGGRV